MKLLRTLLMFFCFASILLLTPFIPSLYAQRVSLSGIKITPLEKKNKIRVSGKVTVTGIQDRPGDMVPGKGPDHLSVSIELMLSSGGTWRELPDNSGFYGAVGLTGEATTCPARGSTCLNTEQLRGVNTIVVGGMGTFLSVKDEGRVFPFSSEIDTNGKSHLRIVAELQQSKSERPKMAGRYYYDVHGPIKIGVEEKEEDKPGTAKIDVKIEFRDRDDKLTPADEALFQLKIKNLFQNKISNLLVKGWLVGEIGKNEVIWFPEQSEKDGKNKFFLLYRAPIKPGESADMEIAIRVAGETNRWVFEKLIKGTTDGKNHNQKPSPELSFPLGKVVHLTITGKLHHDSGEPTEFQFKNELPVWNGKKELELSYPDLSKLAGKPPNASSKNLKYYRMGDPAWCHPGNEFVRAVAIRAARYGDRDDQKALLKKTSMPKGNLVEKGDPDPDGPLFPEKDAGKVVSNVVNFVHQSLLPKGCPKDDSWRDHTISSHILKGNLGPGKRRLQKNWNTEQEKIWGTEEEKSKMAVFICVEHSFLLGSLLRALGFCVREVNFMTIPNTLLLLLNRSYATIGLVERMPGYAQDAGTEVFYTDGKNDPWHFFGLFSDEPFRNHQNHYPRWHTAYEMWVGAARWTGKGHRFHMGSIITEKGFSWPEKGMIFQASG